MIKRKPRQVGEALGFVDRKKIFITTKLFFSLEETEQKLFDRFVKCQERLKTDYVDALFMHAVESVKKMKHDAFHSLADRFLADSGTFITSLPALCHPLSESHLVAWHCAPGMPVDRPA